MLANITVGPMMPRRLWRRGIAAFAATAACSVLAGPAPSALAEVAPPAQAVAANGAWLAWAPAPPSPAAVCLVDTGVSVNADTQGPLAARTALDEGTNDDVDARVHHGTRMAMMMAAPRNGAGMVGAWPALRVVSVRAVAVPPAGGTVGFVFTAYDAAIRRCLGLSQPHAPVKTIELAIGGSAIASPAESELLARRVAISHAAGVSIVAAAGNDGGPVNAPANLPGVLGVAAGDHAGALCAFASRGLGVDLIAPGCELDTIDPATFQAEAPDPDSGGSSESSAFAAANPGVLALDLTLTRWGTVAVGVSAEGLAYTTVPLSRETVRRWVWGDEPSGGPGWWALQLAHRSALDEGHAELAAAHERAWVEAGRELAGELGARLLEPVALGLDRTLAGQVLLLAPGRLSGLPFAAARVGGDPLVAHVRGLAQIASLAELPTGPLPCPRPRRALCVLADPGASTPVERDAGASAAPLEELHDVARLLASGQAEVEVLARVGEAVGEAAFRPTQARTRERTVVSPAPPTAEAVLERLADLDHLYHGGLGWGEGLLLLDGHGHVERLAAAQISAGPRWAPGSSVLLSAAAHLPPPVDEAVAWSLVRAFHDAGVGLVVLSIHPVTPALARELCRGFYLYWALGRSPLEAFTAALANLAGSDPSRVGGLVASLGALAG